MEILVRHVTSRQLERYLPDDLKCRITTTLESLTPEELVRRASLTMEVLTQPGVVCIGAIVYSSAIAWALICGHIDFGAGYFELLLVTAWMWMGVVAMNVWAWGTHYLIHEAARGVVWARYLCPYWRLHMPHHDPDPAINRSFRAEAFELVATLMIAGLPVLLLLLFVPSMRWVIHPAMAIVFFVAYATVHMVNYHHGWTQLHALHHADPRTNIAPSWMDLVAGTSDQVEDCWHIVPNTLLGAGVTLAVAFCWRAKGHAGMARGAK